MPIRGVNRAMRDSKWIPGLSPDMWAVDAARKVLNARLGTVAHYLPLAARQAQEDVEYVHQLRVSTRRAAAAIEVFDDFLTRKARKSGRRALRRIRRAAGTARDADVFLQFLLGELKHGPQHRFPVLDFLVGLTLERRIAAQQQLREAEEEGFQAAEILAGVGESSDFEAPRRFGVLAATVINPLLREFDQAVADAHDDAKALHAIRIRGKELRYAMEIFAPCFAEPFRELLYPAVEQAQEILGPVSYTHL
ncbi:MAG: CHAD domain-containing protein, partial [Gemmataceae bacterium]|nr:CHAD domain-containing protein [Gemmataceae bacterium]